MIESWGIGFEAAKLKARKIYSGIGSIACPFFNEELVVFNRNGFNHLLRRGPKVRPRRDALIRLRLIEYAEAILKNQIRFIRVEFRDTHEIERIINRSGRKVREKICAKSWGFVAMISATEVTLVITQLAGKNKEFLSIMAEKYTFHRNDE